MRRINFEIGEYYHLYNRGVDKRAIFTTSGEYRRFLAYLVLLNDAEVTRHTYALQIDEAKPRKSEQPLVAIGAYCLMPNHFHLYVTPSADDGVSKFMQRLQTAYTMFFNKRHNRSGALLQGTFKAQHVDRDVYAKYLFSYIHLNPAKLKEPRWKELGAQNFKNLKSYIENYPYSSLREYATQAPVIVEPSRFPHAVLPGDFENHITTWLGSELFRGLASKKASQSRRGSTITKSTIKKSALKI